MPSPLFLVPLVAHGFCFSLLWEMLLKETFHETPKPAKKVPHEDESPKKKAASPASTIKASSDITEPAASFLKWVSS